MASRRRGSPRHALLGEPGQPRPVRFGAWLRLFLLGHGRDLLSWPISCLLVGVVVVIPWGMAERQAYLTAAELSQPDTPPQPSHAKRGTGGALSWPSASPSLKLQISSR